LLVARLETFAEAWVGCGRGYEPDELVLNVANKRGSLRLQLGTRLGEEHVACPSDRRRVVLNPSVNELTYGDSGRGGPEAAE